MRGQTEITMQYTAQLHFVDNMYAGGSGYHSTLIKSNPKSFMLHAIVTKNISPGYANLDNIEIAMSTTIAIALAYTTLVSRDADEINLAIKMAEAIQNCATIDKLIVAAAAVDDADLTCWYSVFSSVAAHHAPNKSHVYTSHICAMRVAILSGIAQNVDTLMCSTIKQTAELRYLAFSSPNEKIRRMFG